MTNNKTNNDYKPLTILDGGMGRELHKMGAPFTQPLWSAQALMEAPDYVSLAHKNFVNSGAEIIIVNSYACVPFHLGESLFESDGEALARKAAVIARDVADESDKPVNVAGCIPPALGSYRPDLFEEEKVISVVSTLVEAQKEYVDLWIAETISSLEEFKAIHSVLKASDKDAIYAFTLRDEMSEQAYIRSGQLVSSAVALACFVEAKAIGFNCSVPEVMEQAIREAKQVIENYGADIEIVVYANNFAPISDNHEANNQVNEVREMSTEQYLDYAKAWYQAGATIIGGCCGIGPEYIQKLSDWKKTL